MYNYFFYLLFTFCFIKVNAQSSPEGKTYKKTLSSVCEKMEGGGCNIDTCQVMEFAKDKVSIYKLVKASCTPKEREENYNNKAEPLKAVRYWSIKNNKIFIEIYDEYGKMELKNDKIIAKKGNEITEFLEEK
jgi:hypothetical protein